MRRLIGPSVGLLGQILGILLLTLIVEFGISTLLYERASQFSVRDEEAHRLAEHLILTRHLLAERDADARAAMAAELTTDRYAIRWNRALPKVPPVAPELDAIRAQVLDWEPTLAGSDLRLRLASPGRQSVITGVFTLPDRSWVQFRTREPVTNLNLAVERILIALVPALALMLLAALLIRQTLLPLRRLARAADTIGSGDEEPIAIDGAGEVRRVITAFNRMQARIGRLIADRTQALAAVGHDLRTPLARLRLRTEEVPGEPARAAIQRDIDEMDAMIASLLAFLGGASDPEAPARVDVAVMCATIVDDATDRGREATYVGPDHCDRTLRPLGFKRAVVNLVDNALHYGTRVTLTLEHQAFDLKYSSSVRAEPVEVRPALSKRNVGSSFGPPFDKLRANGKGGESDSSRGIADGLGSLTITIEDDGPGIPEDALDSVTQPFVRLDVARRRDTVGFGLGLAIVAQAVEAEGGTLVLANRAEGGLRATITLPDTK